jgi:hypothetical protein
MDESAASFAIGQRGSLVAAPEPLLAVKQGTDVLFTFPGSHGADGYNIYEGRLGVFTLPENSFCGLNSLDPNFFDNADGTFSYLLAPSGDSRWYLVSASNCADESGLETVLSGGLCGPTR